MLLRVPRTLYEQSVLIDTSAVIALHDEADRYHEQATQLFAQEGLSWMAADVTAHETFTRARYRDGFARARQHFEFLRGAPITLVRSDSADEQSALAILEQYSEHAISFHDALCAAVMRRLGIYRVFTFDRDFWVMGFEVLPGYT